MKTFSIDPNIVDAYLGAGRVAAAAEHHFADEISEARENLRDLEREMERKRRDQRSIHPSDAARVPVLKDRLARLQAQAGEGFERRQADLHFGEMARKIVQPLDMVL